MVATFSDDKRRQSMQNSLDWELCARDPHVFIFGEGHFRKRRHFLLTKDEHSRTPVAPFPDLPYLRCLLDILLVSGGILPPSDAGHAKRWGISVEHLHQLESSRMVAIEKSRQMLVTWLCLAYCLWRAKFMPHQLIMIQSKREDDAKKLVCVRGSEPDAARMTFMERHLPKHLQSLGGTTPGQRGSMVKCNIYFANGSHIWGIPSGSSQIRSHAPSVLFSDESAFQPEFAESYRAAIPALTNGGQAIFVSSAEISAFQELVESTR